MPITIDGTGTISGISAGGLDDSIITPSELASSTSVLFGARNKIINGSMDIAQRGTSFGTISAGSSAYGADRFRTDNTATSAILTVSQQLDAPSNNEFQNSYRVAVNTADTSIAADDAVVILQVIEGYNARDLIGRTFTLSFWVRSSKTGTHCISFQNTGNRTYVAEYTINAANTWEQKSITISGGLITAGTWNWTNGVGLIVAWALAAGTTFQTTAGAWQTGSFLATSNQVNCLDSNTNIFAITGVQLEVGSVATPFEHRPYGAELMLAQRYYENSYTAGVTSSTGQLFAHAYSSARPAGFSYQFLVQKRVTPTTLNIYSPVTGTAARVRNDTTAADVTISSASAIGTNTYIWDVAAGMSAGNQMRWHYEASAEL